MKRFLKYALGGLSAVCAAACFGIDDENYKTLTPIEITVASDTINADLGIELNYTGVTVSSDKEVSYEWTYGTPKSGTLVSDHTFASQTMFSTSPTIDYTFTKIGTYILQLRVDNGESIERHYFTLNVNSGYDEGVAVLNNDSDGNAYLTFIKTLTSEEEARGDQEVFDDVFGAINPDLKMKNGAALFMSNATVKQVDYAGFVITTADENGTIYHLEPKAFEMFKVVDMSEFGTSISEFTGEYASSGGFGAFCSSPAGNVFRYDMTLGNLTQLDDEFNYAKIIRSVRLVNRTSATGATSLYTFFFSQDSVFTRPSASAGVRKQTVSGYNVVNASCNRTGKNIYILLQSKTDPTSYAIKSTPAGSSALRSSLSSVTTFTTDDLKMDSSSKIVGTLNSSDVYYNYDDAIYRWSLTTKPAMSPAITLPEGEQIRDLATNFLGKAKGTGGEDLLYVVTYNPSRAGDKKGSLYVYSFSDDSLVKSYEGIFYDPAGVIYKYRVS